MDSKDKIIFDPRARPINQKEGEYIARLFKTVNVHPDFTVTCSGWPIMIFLALINKLDDHEHMLHKLTKDLKDAEITIEELKIKLGI